MRPLLSWGKSHTGFCSWLWSGTDATEQPGAGQMKYSAGARDPGPLHALPQSWRNTPSPSRPLAPRAETLSAAVPPLAQSEGTAAKPGALMSWIGTEGAFSSAICTSAVAIGPQAYELSTKLAQLPIALPLPSAIRGSERLTREASRR